VQKKREIFPVPHTGNGSKDSNFKNIWTDHFSFQFSSNSFYPIL
jgi:hypothetical protein